MHACDPAFLPLLRGFDVEELDQHGGSVYGLWPDLRLACFNRSWEEFARDNGGEPAISTRWGLNSSVAEAICEPLRRYYALRYSACLKGMEPWDHRYECSSPFAFRCFHMTAYPLGRREGLLVVNSLVVERPHDVAGVPAHSADDHAYVDAHGDLHQCAHCRRVQRSDTPQFWDWIPQWVEKSPAHASHGICPVCLDYYYPDLADEPVAVA